MNKYIVAYISFHDNVMTQELIEAPSEFEAAKVKLGYSPWGDEETLEHLKVSAFDADCMISVYQI